MYIIRIEHPVADFATWKKAFDGDPIGRARSGTRRHRVLRSVEDPRLVMIDLEFDGLEEAESVLRALHKLWGGVQVMRDPLARIVEVVETKEYS